MIAVCPNKDCKKRYRIQASIIGQKAKCKKCGITFKIQEYVEPPKFLDLEPIDDEAPAQYQKDRPIENTTIPQQSEEETKPKFRPHVVIIAALAAVAIVALITENRIQFFSQSENSGRLVIPSSPLAPPPVVTKAKYDQVLEGMSYEQAKAIIGNPGEEISRSDVAGFKTIMYQWVNHNGAGMNAMFQNGKLIQKAQFGLP